MVFFRFFVNKMQAQEIAKKIWKLKTLLPVIFVSTETYSGLIEILWKDNGFILRCIVFFDITSKQYRTAITTYGIPSNVINFYKNRFGTNPPNATEM